MVVLSKQRLRVGFLEGDVVLGVHVHASFSHGASNLSPVLYEIGSLLFLLSFVASDVIPPAPR